MEPQERAHDTDSYTTARAKLQSDNYLSLPQKDDLKTRKKKTLTQLTQV